MWLGHDVKVWKIKRLIPRVKTLGQVLASVLHRAVLPLYCPPEICVGPGVSVWLGPRRPLVSTIIIATFTLLTFLCSSHSITSHSVQYVIDDDMHLSALHLCIGACGMSGSGPSTSESCLATFSDSSTSFWECCALKLEICNR